MLVNTHYIWNYIQNMVTMPDHMQLVVCIFKQVKMIIDDEADLHYVRLSNIQYLKQI